MKVVNFTKMEDGTQEEYELIRRFELEHASHTASRLLKELKQQEQDTMQGFRVTRLDHALQTATRAYRDGADIDWVVCGLLHDIGDGLAAMNHDRFAAEVLRPFVREECTWAVEHHGVFQMYYYGHHLGWDRHGRDRYRDSPYFQACADFCERWDQTSFDPDYVPESLDFFAPMVEQVFARTPWAAETIQAGITLGIVADSHNHVHSEQ